ncbi:MAG TPA: hypothetical protein VIL51_03555 [Thermoleophilia bacterium]
MRVPPYLFSLRVAEAGRTKVRLWLPMFIVWPLLLVLGLLAVIVALLVDLVFLVTAQRPRYTAFVVGCLGLAGEARGTEVFVNKESQTVVLTIR